jgi:A/G-specific adenine glycosylase
VERLSDYYRRAHHLHAAARKVVAKHWRPISSAMPKPSPRCRESARSTAAAIAAFAFGERAAILEGNVKARACRHPRHRRLPGHAERRGGS